MTEYEQVTYVKYIKDLYKIPKGKKKEELKYFVTYLKVLKIKERYLGQILQTLFW